MDIHDSNNASQNEHLSMIALTDRMRQGNGLLSNE